MYQAGSCLMSDLLLVLHLIITITRVILYTVLFVSFPVAIPGIISPTQVTVSNEMTNKIELTVYIQQQYHKILFYIYIYSLVVPTRW